MRDLINRKMSQVKTKLRHQKLEKKSRIKGSGNDCNAVKTHRVVSQEYPGLNSSTKGKSYREKMSACRQLLDKISVRKNKNNL